MAKVYKKFGNRLASPKGFLFYKPSYKTTGKFLTKVNPIVAALYQETTNSTFDNLVCSVCGSNHRVEFHHIRAMKELKPKISYMDKLMVKINRKIIPLCRPCHMLKHRNRETVFEKTDADTK